MRKYVIVGSLLWSLVTACQFDRMETPWPSPSEQIEVTTIEYQGRQIWFPRETAIGALLPKAARAGPQAETINVQGNCLIGVTGSFRYVMVWQTGFSGVANASETQIRVLDANGNVFVETGTPDANVRGWDYEIDSWYLAFKIPDECKRLAKFALYVYGRNSP